MKDWQFRKVPINAVFIATTGLWSDTCLALQRTHVLFVCPKAKFAFETLSAKSEAQHYFSQ